MLYSCPLTLREVSNCIASFQLNARNLCSKFVLWYKFRLNVHSTEFTCLVPNLLNRVQCALQGYVIKDCVFKICTRVAEKG